MLPRKLRKKLKPKRLKTRKPLVKLRKTKDLQLVKQPRPQNPESLSKTRMIPALISLGIPQ
jgi:hypothetical protein